ncbi:MAG TPA: HAD hydrolase-like protein [Candidatus Lokiarchaeia archaeon]|nr:HAD hydrolase-like protein [Candidatus Lokiarchaeia archaeon]
MEWPAPARAKPSSPPKFLALFDIDGTLMIGIKVHKESFYAALRDVYGVSADIQWAGYSGLTDPLIVRELAMQGGIPEDEIEAKMPVALDRIGTYHEEHYQEDDGKVLPGIPELLAELERRHVLMGLVTGNVVKCAYYKLMNLAIERYFSVGGFGSDDADRSKLIEIATQRAELNYKFKNNGHNVVYVADTSRDIEAARKAGVPIIIIRNERTRDDAFDDPEPDLLLPDATRKDEFLEFIKNMQTSI